MNGRVLSEEPYNDKQLDLIETTLNSPECPEDSNAVHMMKRLIATIRDRDKTIAELRTELMSENERVVSAQSTYKALMKQNSILREGFRQESKQNAIMREALYFYANEDNYLPEHYIHGAFESTVDCDSGKCARDALAKVKEVSPVEPNRNAQTE